MLGAVDPAVGLGVFTRKSLLKVADSLGVNPLPYGKIASQFLNLTTSRGQESTRFRLQLFEERHRPPSVVTPVAPKFCADPGTIEGTEQSVHPVRRARQRAAAPRPREDPLGQREASLLPRQSWVPPRARSAR